MFFESSDSDEESDYSKQEKSNKKKINDEYDTDEETEEENEDFLPDNRIKEIESWLESTKNYVKSGVFNRLHNDISRLIKENKFKSNKYKKIQQQLNNTVEQSRDLQGIIEDSVDECTKILNNLEIDVDPENLIEALKIIKTHTEKTKYLPTKIEIRSKSKKIK
jgi:hypothetical protein